MKIKSIRKVPYSGKVYNFAVTPNESYFAENVAVHNCYMASSKQGKHAPADLIERIISGFDQAPYQVAFGGGEPTMHPQFPDILRKTRELGSVPNYTTNGSFLRKDVIEATNAVVGGVSMTYHPKTGGAWFEEHFRTLREALDPRVALNVQLIADVQVQDTLETLTALEIFRPWQPGIDWTKYPKPKFILLAYYPDTGRASLSGLMTRHVYQKKLPSLLLELKGASFEIGFSEGLLPYFLSRPELGMTNPLMHRSEGLFSCYFDDAGAASTSSFRPPWREDAETVYNKRAQELWDSLSSGNSPDGEACSCCEHARICSNPTSWHYALCAKASHNKG